MAEELVRTPPRLWQPCCTLNTLHSQNSNNRKHLRHTCIQRKETHSFKHITKSYYNVSTKMISLLNVNAYML